MYFSAVDGLKKLYKSKILPVEEMYKYGNVGSPSLKLVLVGVLLVGVLVGVGGRGGECVHVHHS